MSWHLSWLDEDGEARRHAVAAPTPAEVNAALLSKLCEVAATVRGASIVVTQDGELDQPEVVFTALCRVCRPPDPVPFRSAAERDTWADEHEHSRRHAIERGLEYR